MFKALTRKLLASFRENVFPELTDDEREALANKDSPILRYAFLFQPLKYLIKFQGSNKNHSNWWSCGQWTVDTHKSH